MNKQERTEAANLITTAPAQHTKRFELKLPCGMWVRCDNTRYHIERVASKFLKPLKLPPNAANLLKRRLWR